MPCSPNDGGLPTVAARRTVAADKFITETGVTYAGQHLIADFWGGVGLDDAETLRAAIRAAAHAAGATILHLHLHRFGEELGVSGVAVLAESHISVHTWPERGYAAFDAFLCGGTDAGAALQELERHVRPTYREVRMLRRGSRSSGGDPA